MSLPIPNPLLPPLVFDFFTAMGFEEKGRDLAPVVFVILTIASWPIALALRIMHAPVLRLLISSLTGIALMIGVYGWQTTCFFIVFVVTFYIPCRYKLMGPGLVSALALMTLGGVHYDAMLSGTATDRMSQTGTLMMIVAKICMFAFHMEDGRRREAGLELSAHAHVAASRGLSAVNAADVNLIKFLCYNFEFQGGVVGPLFTYAEFMDFVHLRGDFKSLSQVPFGWASVKAAARAFSIVGAYMYLSGQSWFGAQVLVTDWFLAGSFWWKLVVTPFLIAGCRLAYYSGWAMSEVACTLSGLALQPPNRFTRGRNTNLRKFELSTNFNQVTANWNIRISELWLKQCVYQRIDSVPPVIRPIIGSHKALANLTTKITSAFWHGWYAGYGTSFLSLGIGNWTENVMRKRLHPRIPQWLASNPLSSIFAWIHTWWSVNFFFAPFVLLTWERTITFYSSMYWCMHLYHLFIISALTIFMPPKVEAGAKKKL